MYVTEPPARVTALDVKTGRPLWSWSRPISDEVLTVGFWPTNRGVAILGETLYVGTLDGYLVALDAKSGAERWTVHVGDNAVGHSITAAPLALAGKIIVGISGGEAGIRGFLDAYDAKSGKRLWRFYTIPGEGEPGNESWGDESWKTGGGTTWLTGSYDPELNLLYWGTGNPAPGLERRRSPRRQPLHMFPGRSRPEHRQVALAFPVHAPRRPRLGRQPDTGACGL